MDVKLSLSTLQRNNARIPEPTEAWKAMTKRIKANAKRREKDQMLRDLGLTKVRGAVSGRTYWE